MTWDLIAKNSQPWKALEQMFYIERTADVKELKQEQTCHVRGIKWSWIMVDSRYCTCVQTHRMDSNSVPHGLWAIMIFHCRFIPCNKCPSGGDVDNTGGCACGMVREYMGILCTILSILL